MASAGFCALYVSVLGFLVVGVPIDRPMSEVFREVRLRSAVGGRLLEPASGSFAIVEAEGSLVVIGRPMRDDPFELVSVWPGFFVAGVIGSPIRERLFELTAGCVAVLEVDGLVTVICLPIRERALLFELVSGCREDAEVEGCPAVIRVPICERKLLAAASRLVSP
jgi:hypothetical protein